MAEVFITNVQDRIEAERVQNILESRFPGLNIHFDLADPKLPFPCGHNIIRIEGAAVDPESVISTVNGSGFMCDVLEDKICK